MTGRVALGSRFQSILAAAIGLVFVVGLWQAVVVLFKIHPIILPTPLQVLQTGYAERTALGIGVLQTGLAAASGLILSAIVGTLVAMLFSQSHWIRSAFHPYVVLLQTVPIVAIAPLLITWSGYQFRTIVLISSIISLFPIVSNVTEGLCAVDPNLKDYFRLCGATRWQTLVKLRIPNAVRYFVLGLKSSAGLAVVGAIIGEFFVGTGISAATGSKAGLGTLMTGWQNLARTDALIAVIFASTCLGLVMLTIVETLDRTLLCRWTSGLTDSTTE